MVVYSYYLELKEEDDSYATQGDDKYYYATNPA